MIVRSVLLGVTYAIGTCLAAVPVRAAEEAPRYLSFDARAAVSADVDADRDREVVLVTGGAGGSNLRSIEIWDHEGGEWRSASLGPITRPGDRGAAGSLIDARTEAIGLLAWRADSGEQALLVTGGDAGDYGGGCCLRLATVSEVDGRVALQWLDVADGRAEQVAVLDADGDGVDELLVIEPPDGAGDVHVRLLRWTGAFFEEQRASLGPDDSASRRVQVGETDGVPGDEAVFAVDGGRALTRIGMSADGALITESGRVGDAPELHLWSWGAAGGSVVIQVGTELRVLAWPRGGELRTTAQAFRPEYPDVAVVGSGRDAVIVDRGVVGFDPRNAPTVHLLDLQLRDHATVSATEPIEEMWRLANIRMPALRSQLDSLRPYIGPFPGRMRDGSSAYIASGNLVSVPAAGPPRVRAISSLTGLMPVGIAGRDNAWWVLDSGHLDQPDWTLLVIGSAPARVVSVVPERLALEADDSDPLEVELRHAAVTTTETGEERLLVDEGSFEVMLSGPPGSLVLGVVDQWVVHEGVLPDGPVTLAMEPLRRGDTAQTVEAAVVRIDPAGRVAAVAWDGDVRRGPPELSVTGRTVGLAPRSLVSGRTVPDATVNVDGREVEVDRSGGFSIQVDAPIWPRSVSVMTRDALGHEATLPIQVVGFVDYRGFPWIVVIGIATLAAGAFLFVRVPQRRRAATEAWDDAVLEEIDGGRG